MKNVKWTANELLESLNKECNQEEVNELYKALIAYGAGLEEITEIQDYILDDIIKNDYFGDDSLISFVNEELMGAATRKLFNN